MGGHGGLNILPQKSWNVYNYENREKVRRDEDAAAREEQLKREQSRRRDSEHRLQLLRNSKTSNNNNNQSTAEPASQPSAGPTTAVDRFDNVIDSGHVSLFDEGIPDFSSLASEGRMKLIDREEEEDKKKEKRKKKKEPAVVVGPEDEKYKLGYGLAGKGVKAPWYLLKPLLSRNDDDDEEEDRSRKTSHSGEKKRKKTVEELREERVKREKLEKERERAVISAAKRDGGFSRRRM